MRIAIVACVLAWTSVAAADPLDRCPASDRITLGTRVAAKSHVTYELALADLRVCIGLTGYPLMKRGGHQLHACFVVASGTTSDRFCGTANAFYADHGRYRITISLRRPSHADPPDVWLQIDLKP